MKDLIAQYYQAATLLEKRSKEILERMKKERNVFELHKLERRRQLLDIERYEIMRDIRAMEESLPEKDCYAEAV